MRITALKVAFTCLALFAIIAIADEERLVDVAKFDDEGNLVVPANLDEWVFIGSSLGMGYSQDNFDPDSPGMFQIARMEPEAYQIFKETGESRRLPSCD